MYHSVTAQKIFIHPGSSWFKQLPENLLAGEIVATSKMFARSVSPLKKEWLDEISPTLRLKLQGDSANTSSKKRDKNTKTKDLSGQEKTITIFGTSYPALKSKKGRKVIAAIPLRDAKEVYLKLGGSKKNISHTPSTNYKNAYKNLYQD